MSSRSPSPYCGANIVRFQSGNSHVGMTSSAATTTSTRGSGPTGLVRRPSRRSSSLLTTSPPRPASLRLHDEIALHLLVERRAEVRAVVGEHARLVGLEGDGLRLAGVEHEVDVVVEQAEPVQLVRGLLDVR